MGFIFGDLHADDATSRQLPRAAMQFLEEDPELTDRIEQIVRAKLMPEEFDAPESLEEDK